MAANESWETNSAEATAELGADLGRCLVGGMVIGLVGPLGAGKTQLVRGIALGNARDDACEVTSPTFTLVNEYPGRFHIYHVDVYRLKKSAEVAEVAALGFDEWQTPDSVVVVEWAQRIETLLGDDALWINLEPTGETGRRLTFDARGDAAVRCLDQLRRMRGC